MVNHLYGFALTVSGYHISNKGRKVVMSSDKFQVDKYQGRAIWFGDSYFDGTTVFYSVTNISAEVQSIGGIVASMVACNSGGLVIPLWDPKSEEIYGSFGPTSGNGGEMTCILFDADHTQISNSTIVDFDADHTWTSNTYTVDDRQERNLQIDGDHDETDFHNWACWFNPRPGPEHTFKFNEPIQIQTGKSVYVSFKMESWSKTNPSGSNTIQIAGTDTIEIAEPTEAELTIVSDPAEAFKSISSGGKYEPGTNLSLSAQLNEGYQFIGWVNKGVTVSTSPKFTYTMPEYDVTLHAIAQKTPNYIWVYRIPEGAKTGKWHKEKIAYRYNKQGGWKPI